MNVFKNKIYVIFMWHASGLTSNIHLFYLKCSVMAKFNYSNLFFILRRYSALLLWILFTAILFFNSFINLKTLPQHFYLRSILGLWLCISRGTTPVLIMCSVFVVLPVCRSLNTFIHYFLAKISPNLLTNWLAKIKIVHMICAITLIIFSVIHTISHIINTINFSKYYSTTFPEINLAKYKGENPVKLICTLTGYTGIGMIIILLIIALTSTSKFRKKYFNIFYLTHHLFVIYLILLYTHPFSGILKEQYNINQHKPGCILIKNETKFENSSEFCKYPPKFKRIPSQSWIYILIVLIIYFIEILLRKCKSNQFVVIQACQMYKNAIHLKFKCPENFKIDPGQYILLQCNDISRIEWHPFTVTKCPERTDFTFDILIGIKGDWTRHLKKLINTPFSFNVNKNYIKMYKTPLRVSVNGPFVSPMQSIKNCKYVICIAAGLGITSYVACLHYLLKNTNHFPKRIHLMWLTREPAQFMWYSKLLIDLQDKFWNNNQPDRLQIQLFVTKQEKQSDVICMFKGNKLQSRINFGRPKWDEQFRIFNFMYNKKTLAVFCCGPKQLRADLRNRCLSANKKGYKYKYYQEGF